MRKFSVILFMVFLFISGCGEQTEKGILPFAATEVTMKNVDSIVMMLKNAGFNNIELLPVQVLEDELDTTLENTVYEIQINGKNNFEREEKVDLNSKIIIQYYVYRESVLPFLSKDAKGKSYEEILNMLYNMGFYNVNESLIRDINVDNIYDDEGEYITIDSNNNYSCDDVFPLNSEIVVYHSLREEKMPILSEETKGKSLDELNVFFENTKFELEYKLIKDNDKDNIHEDEIEYIEVLGSSEYTLEDTFPIGSKVIIYHSLIEYEMPILSEEAKGKSYDEIVEIFKDTKFNVQYELVKDADNDNKHKNEIESIKIDSRSDYSLDDTYVINSKVIIYHSYIEDRMPITSDSVKGKSTSEIRKLFNNTKFENVTFEATNSSIGEIEIAEQSVDRICINGKSDYTTKETFSYDSPIVVYFSAREYDVQIELDCQKSGFFSPTYDIDVYVDDIKLGTLNYEEKGIYNIKVKKGTYNLILKSKEDSGITGTLEINVNADGNVRCDVSCKSFNVDIKYYKPLSVPITSSGAVGKNIDDIVKMYENAGYKNVKTKVINDLDVENLSKSNCVSKIVINNNSNFNKSSIFYDDSIVEIHYHAGKLIEVPMDNFDVDRYEFEQVEAAFSEAGFVNIVVEPATGYYSYDAKDKMVSDVRINGDKLFSLGDKEPIDANVVIQYYSINYEPCKVSKMMKELENNAYRAKEYYKDKYVSVTGWVESVDSNGRNFNLVKSSSEWEILGVTCKIIDKTQKALLEELSKGKKVTVKGKITWISDYSYELYIHDISY